MASVAPSRDRAFINITTDPKADRAARRKHVRQAVMLDYHKRRKNPRKHRPAPSRQLEGDGNVAESTSFGTNHPETQPFFVSERTWLASDEPVSSPLSTHLELRSQILFLPKTWKSSQTSRISSLIFRFLCGQTSRVTQDVTNVSFIHRQFGKGAHQSDADVSGNSLMTCKRILREYKEGKITNGALWRLVHAEQERIYLQHEHFSKWELLSATQTITLYILQWLRMGSNHADFPCGNIALLFTLGKIFEALKTRHFQSERVESMEPSVSNWQDWIFHESCFRTAYVYFILTLIVSMDIGFGCNRPTDWRIEALPRPATKVSWDAGDHLSWERTVRDAPQHSQSPSHFIGDPNLPEKTESLWGEALDEMGLIVAMAAELQLDFAA
ncbi:hypothetical protein BGZ63DRAFT_59611 [Mariannaea sp. PMI_226]|nr:hypothetical protein BGZ63DRAFT_59611 [Mariannaea sp. PMI_226]